MAKVKVVGATASFMCPGCGEYHSVGLAGSRGPQWGWNGDKDRPTFTPSVLFRSGHFTDRQVGDCWCDYNREHPEDVSFECRHCHSFVRDGNIEFLQDCSHGLAGKTVQLPDLED